MVWLRLRAGVEAFLELVAQDFPRSAARELVVADEHDVLRLLVARELGPAAREELVLSERRVGRRHERDGHLAPPRVLFSHDGGFGHARVVEEHAFDLGGVDVLAAALDEVIHAIDELEQALRIPHEYVAEVEPTTAKDLRVRLGGAEVAA